MGLGLEPVGRGLGVAGLRLVGSILVRPLVVGLGTLRVLLPESRVQLQRT